MKPRLRPPHRGRQEHRRVWPPQASLARGSATRTKALRTARPAVFLHVLGEAAESRGSCWGHRAGSASSAAGCSLARPARCARTTHGAQTIVQPRCTDTYGIAAHESRLRRNAVGEDERPRRPRSRASGSRPAGWAGAAGRGCTSRGRRGRERPTDDARPTRSRWRARTAARRRRCRREVL